MTDQLKMTPEAQRIAIAQLLGWKIEHTRKHGDDYYRVTKPSGAYCCEWATQNALGYLPDFLSDLNAMHEAEKVLRGLASDENSQKGGYSEELIAVCCAEPEKEIWFFDIAHATAAQRAEAFLRTLNLWRDE